MNELADRAFRRHYDHVYRYLRRRTGDHHRAEELAQQVFADAAASLRKTDSSSLAWLYTVAQRRFADEVRRESVGRGIGALPPVGAAEQAEYGADIAAALRAAIERLPAGQRDVLVLKLLRGAAFAEIGAALKLSPEAAKMRFVRALEALRGDLEERGVRP